MGAGRFLALDRVALSRVPGGDSALLARCNKLVGELSQRHGVRARI
jgi:hypothetical protein